MCSSSTLRDVNRQSLQIGTVKDGSYRSALSHSLSHTRFVSLRGSGAEWPGLAVLGAGIQGLC